MIKSRLYKLNIKFKSFTLLIFLAPLLLLFYQPAFAEVKERINSFESEITVQENGAIYVKETIVYDFGPNQRHGIYRNIPLIKTNIDGDKFRMISHDIAVSDEQGSKIEFQNQSTSSQISLKIGDPNVTISGVHTYIIYYKIEGALAYFSDHDELYWNITGNDWEVPINLAKTKIHLPETIPDSEIKLTCYTGTEGSTAKDCLSSVSKDGSIISNTTKNLLPKEGLTVAVSFPKGFVQVMEPKIYTAGVIQQIITVILGILAFLYYAILPIYVLRRRLKTKNKHKDKEKVVAAWFDIPRTSKNNRGLTAGEVGVIFDNSPDIRDITATLVQLAQKGYMKIREDVEKKFLADKKTFALTKIKEPDEHMTDYEKYLFDSIFTKLEIKMEDLGKKKTFHSKIDKTLKKMSQLTKEEGFFTESPYSFIKKSEVFMVLSGMSLNIFLFLVFFFTRKGVERTEKGAETAGVIKSVYNFVKSQEKQFEFQAQNYMLFEKFLPYAISLGVEDIWVERFKDLDMPQPDWFEGADARAFSYTALLHSLNGSVSAATTMSSSRSSSGFSSGFSGGSSGGGGGGGGGGSW